MVDFRRKLILHAYSSGCSLSRQKKVWQAFGTCPGFAPGFLICHESILKSGKPSQPREVEVPSIIQYRIL
jgi:hypothetical protein